MKKTATRTALRARLVLPMNSPPIDGGVITLAHGRIVGVGENLSSQHPVDLGDVALLPGLINAHTHLEFSNRTGPLGTPGMPFPDWIEMVVNNRRRATSRESAMFGPSERLLAFRQGIRESLHGGVTAIGNTSTWSISDTMLPSSAPHCFEFREWLGLNETTVSEQLELMRSYAAEPVSERIMRGLSPHAPYTTAPELVRAAAKFSKTHRLNLAMHLAESPEELRLLSRGDGPFRDVLERLGAWQPRAVPGGHTPSHYLEILAKAHRSLVIHGNFLQPRDWDCLARNRDRMSLVYCPRTHHFFGYPPYPLDRMRHAGVRVVLGTDGRASNPDLEAFKELQFVTGRHTEISPRDVLCMMTVDAAEALGCTQRMGSLERGKNADLVEVKLGQTANANSDPYAAVLDEQSQVCGVYLHGIRQ